MLFYAQCLFIHNSIPKPAKMQPEKEKAYIKIASVRFLFYM